MVDSQPLTNHDVALWCKSLITAPAFFTVDVNVSVTGESADLLAMYSPETGPSYTDDHHQPITEFNTVAARWEKAMLIRVNGIKLYDAMP
jgi:hypothetical protein